MDTLIENIQVSPDETVIRKILAGDISLFEILIRRHNTAIYRIARSYGFSHQDAEDLMQDTHVDAYTHLSQFEGRAAYKTWISRIMINKCIYKLKYGYFKHEIPVEEFTNNMRPMYVNEEGNPDGDKILKRELSAALELSIQNIPPIYRTIFVLREVEGFSVAETAELSNISETNVKVRLNRAKALLQKQMQNIYTRAELFSFNLIYCDAMVRRVFTKINFLKPEMMASNPQ